MNEELWIPQGETRIFDINDHLIYIVEENLEDIEIPEGYYTVKVDEITIKHKPYTRMFLENEVPVEAELYKNKRNREICYYFPGKVIKQKVLKK